MKWNCSKLVTLLVRMRVYSALLATIAFAVTICFFFAARLNSIMPRSFYQNTPEEFIDSEYKKLWNVLFVKKTVWIQSIVSNGFNQTNDDATEQFLIEQNNIEEQMEMSEFARKSELRKLGTIIQRKLFKLQNPKHCNTSRVLICSVPLSCGFGCYTHFITNCLIQAFESERVIVLRSENFRYTEQGWEEAFLPLSKCNVDLGREEAPSIENVTRYDTKIVGLLANYVPTWLPWTIPQEISSPLASVHGDPFAWWLGQFVSYALRPQPWLVQRLKNKINELDFESPIVGLHVRRGDKLATEATPHELNQYMFFVEQWYRGQQMKGRNLTKAVFLATEDMDVVNDLAERYPDFKFISNLENLINTAGKNKHKRRFSLNGLDSIFIDMYLLSRCEYVVCTLSSNVCRVVYNLMMISQSDPSIKVQSVDMIFQYKRTTNAPWRAVLRHTPSHAKDLAMEPGDTIEVSMDTHFPYLKGYLNGTNTRTNNIGLFPAIKARPHFHTHQFSILQNLV